MHRDIGQSSFADVFVSGGGNRRLERISSLLDWDRISALLEGVYASTTGRPSFPPLVLFKVLLLQGWYGLGDPAMEEALGDRLSFRRFAGLGLEDRVPDHSTISRFRTLLAKRGLAQALFEEVARQLDEAPVGLRPVRLQAARGGRSWHRHRSSRSGDAGQCSGGGDRP